MNLKCYVFGHEDVVASNNFSICSFGNKKQWKKSSLWEELLFSMDVLKYNIGQFSNELDVVKELLGDTIDDGSSTQSAEEEAQTTV